MFRENILRGLLIAAAFGLVAKAAAAESFDKPLQQKIVDLGRSVYLMPNSKSRVQLSCSYYPGFMLKELNDPGLKGAELIAVVAVPNRSQPACRKARASSERRVGNQWSGYFLGVKGQLVFLDAADGMDGGMPFRVFDWKTMKTVFEDSALYWDGGMIQDRISFTHASDGKSSMSYRRVVEGDCSIPKDGATCWNKLRTKYQLPLADPPKCIGYRVAGEKGAEPGTWEPPAADTDAPSAIAYPVLVTVFPKPSIKAVAGSVRCTPVD